MLADNMDGTNEGMSAQKAQAQQTRKNFAEIVVNLRFADSHSQNLLQPL